MANRDVGPEQSRSGRSVAAAPKCLGRQRSQPILFGAEVQKGEVTA